MKSSDVNILVPEEILTRMGVTPIMLQGKVAVMITLARNHLLFQAQRKLHGTAQEYIGGISAERITGFKAEFTLNGRFPNMLEWGAPPWDLRETLLRSSSRGVKVSKKGFRYMSIPFRHMGENATGRNGKPLGSAYAKLLGKAEGKRIASAVMTEVNRIKSNPRNSSISGYTGIIPASVGGPLLRARHLTGLYSGMVVIQKVYDSGAKSSQLMTFRTISNNPRSVREDGGGRNWMHPGLTARGFFKKTQKYIQLMSPTVLGVPGGKL